MEEAVLANGGDVDIRKAVVIVIGDGDAQAVHFDRKARALRHIGKGAVAVVPVKLHGGALALVARPVATIDEKDIEPSVVIVIEKRAARSHGFGQEFRAISAAVVVDPDRSFPIALPTHFLEFNRRWMHRTNKISRLVSALHGRRSRA